MTSINYKKIIVFTLILTAVFALVPLNNLHAQTEDEGAFATPGETLPPAPPTGPAAAGAGTAATRPTAINESVATALNKAECGVGGIWAVAACPILYFSAWIVFVVLMAVSAFFALFGNLFDLVTTVTLNPGTYSLPAIYQGWTIARDSANLFFIFILLTIAIATILQIETYGAKRLLPKLIIAALFINFSFLLTQYVIFSANLMTGFFLPGAGTKGGPSSQLSVMFLAGINPNAMYKGTQFNLNAISDTQKKLREVRQKIKNLDDGTDAEDDLSLVNPELLQAERDEAQLQTQLESQQKELPNTLIQLIVAMLGVIAFILVATFALAFAGISLLIRVVILWFIMILSPVAFLFWVVPGLSSHASKWWNKLVEQAFFPVAFFFLFGLTVQMISTPQARSLFENADRIARQAGAGAVNTALIVSFTSVAYYTLLIIMLIASVLVAKSMGGVAAEWAEKGAKYARGALGGALAYGGGRTLRYGRSYAAPIAEKLATTEDKRVSWLRRIPGLTRGLSGVAAAGRGDIGDMQKQYDKYSNAELKNLIGQVGTPRDSRMAITNILTSRNDLKEGGKLAPELIKDVKKRQESAGMFKEAKAIGKLLYQYAQTDEDWKEVGRELKPSQIADISGSFFDRAQGMESLWANGGMKHIQNILDERNAEEKQKFFKHLEKNAGGSNIKQITDYLGKIGNQSLASQLEADGPHRALLSAYINYSAGGAGGGGGGSGSKIPVGSRGPNNP